MLLAVDVGNTNSVFALIKRDEVIGEWRISTQAHRTADEYGMWLLQLFKLHNIDASQIKGAILSTVVPDAQFALTMMCRTYCSIEPMIVGNGEVRIDMDVAIDKPEEVGADRLVNAYAAWKRYEKPLIVIDFGTATTFDVVAGDGSYRGGVIAPGVNLSLDALHKAAAKLPNVRVCAPEKVIGTSTVTAMQSGIYYGYLSMIEGMIARIKKEYGAEMTVLATGGLAPLYADKSDVITKVESDLTIYGLKEIYQLNEGN